MSATTHRELIAAPGVPADRAALTSVPVHPAAYLIGSSFGIPEVVSPASSDGCAAVPETSASHECAEWRMIVEEGPWELIGYDDDGVPMFMGPEIHMCLLVDEFTITIQVSATPGGVGGGVSISRVMCQYTCGGPISAVESQR